MWLSNHAIVFKNIRHFLRWCYWFLCEWLCISLRCRVFKLILSLIFHENKTSIFNFIYNFIKFIVLNFFHISVWKWLIHHFKKKIITQTCFHNDNKFLLQKQYFSWKAFLFQKINAWIRKIGFWFFFSFSFKSFIVFVNIVCFLFNQLWC